MKIDRKVFTGFLNKVQMSGTQQIQECIFDFGKDGLKVNADCPTEQSKSMGWLKTPAFKVYEEIGKIGINELDKFIKVVDKFSDLIELPTEGNVATIKDKNGKVDIELVDVNFISTPKEEPDLEFEETFKLPAKKLQTIFGAITLNKDTVISITTVPKNVAFSNTGKYRFNYPIGAPTCKGGVKVDFGEPLIDATTKLDGELEMSIGNNYPSKITEKGENMVITLIVAPRVAEDGAEEKTEEPEEEEKSEE